MSAPRHFLDIHTVSAGDLRGILDRAIEIKQARRGRPKGTRDERESTAANKRIKARLLQRSRAFAFRQVSPIGQSHSLTVRPNSRQLLALR